jgi:hypothetical protein
MDEVQPCPECGSPMFDRGAVSICVACALGEAMDETGQDGGLGRIGGLELMEVLAQGGMGVVYRARQESPSREVALKALPSAALLSPDARARFRQEAEAMAGLDHPSILPVYELGDADGALYFTMKLVSGGTLAERLEGFQGRWREIAALVARVAEAVQFAHEQGVLHRDLKPGNILFDEQDRSYVSDFGIAKIGQSDAMGLAGNMGTPSYMAPEVATGGKVPVTTAADVWSLGAILYELLTGRAPFIGGSVAEILRAVGEDELEKMPHEVPRDLAAITTKCLEKNPANRYQSARRLVEDLRRWLAGEPILARSVPWYEKAVMLAKRRPGVAAGWLVAMMTMLVSAGLLYQAATRLREAVATAQEQEGLARGHLAESLLAQARLLRRSREVGRREAGLGVIREAVAIYREQGGSARMERGAFLSSLRDEAVGLLALDDLKRIGTAFEFQSLGWSARSFALTPDFERGLGRLKQEGTGLYEMQTGRMLWRHEPEEGADFVPASFHLTADAGYAGIVSRSGWLEVWEVASNKRFLRERLIGQPSHSAYRGTAFAFHPQKPKAAWVDAAGRLMVADLETQTVREWARDLAGGTALVFHETEPLLAVGVGKGTEEWNLQTGTRKPLLKASDSGAELAWVKRALVTSDRMDKLSHVIESGKAVASHNPQPGYAVRISALPWGNQVVSLSSVGRLSMWSHLDGEVTLEMPAGKGLMELRQGGREMVLAGDEGEAVKWEWQTSPVFREYGLAFSMRGAATGQVVEQPDGRLLISRGNTGMVFWDAKVGRYVGRWLFTGSGNGVFGAQSRDGLWIYGSRQMEGVWRRSMRWTEGGELELGEPERLAGLEAARFRGFGADGVTLWVEKKGGVGRWTPGESELSWVANPVEGLSLMESGKYAVANPRQTEMKVIDLATQQEVATLPVGLGSTGVLSPGDDWLVIREARQTRFIEVATWLERVVWPHGDSAVRGWFGAVSHDGRMAAVIVGNSALNLITLPEGRRLATLAMPSQIALESCCFSRDGSRLFVIGNGQRLTEWNLEQLWNELSDLGFVP